VVALVRLAATGGTDDRLFVGFSLHFTGPRRRPAHSSCPVRSRIR
jgi:hypothetical protein